MNTLSTILPNLLGFFKDLGTNNPKLSALAAVGAGVYSFPAQIKTVLMAFANFFAGLANMV